MRFLALIFIIVPLTEMLLLFEVSDRIGGWSTLALVVATAIIGLQILKWQGLSTLLRANERLRSGELPAQEIVEGMLLAGSGALLLTPGFITDTIGFCFLIAPLRRPLARRVVQTGVVSAMSAGQSGSGFRVYSGAANRSYSESDSGTVVEGEYSQDSGVLPGTPESTPASEQTQDKKNSKNNKL